MARLTCNAPDELISQLDKLGDGIEDLVKEMLEEASDPLHIQVRTKLASSIGRDLKYPSRSTGALMNSMKVTKVYQDGKGAWNIKLGFYGYGSDGRPNGIKAAVLENGKSNQRAKPFLKPAIAASKSPCIQRMQQVFNRRMMK